MRKSLNTASRSLNITTVRGRLTLWSMGVLTFTLVGCALIVHFTVSAFLMTSIDQDLAHEARAAFPIAAFRLPDTGMMTDKPSQMRLLPNSVQQAHTDQKWMDQELNDRAALPIDQLQHRGPPNAGNANVVYHNFFLQTNLKPDFSERHRFMLIRVRDSRGKMLGAATGIGGLNKSVWDQQFALAGGHERYATLVSGRQEWRVLTMPSRVDGRIDGDVQVSYPLQELNSLMRGLDRTLFILIPLALLVAGIGGAGLTDRALRPVRQITQAAMEVEANDLSRRLPVTGGDEFAELATTFNGMFERLQAAFTRLEDAVRQQQRFTADASHELRTPLTTVRANADWALRKPRHVAEYEEALHSIVQAVDRTDQLIEGLLCLARSDSGHPTLEPRPLALLEVLQRVLDAMPGDAATAAISLDIADTTLGTIGSEEQLERVFVNLVQNALRHTPVGGMVRLFAHARDERVIVTVEDTGEGIPPEHLPHICERFYRVDEARSRPSGGAGLGLAICQSIVQAHGGAVQIESAVGVGTRVSVILPLLRLT